MKIDSNFSPFGFIRSRQIRDYLQQSIKIDSTNILQHLHYIHNAVGLPIESKLNIFNAILRIYDLNKEDQIVLSAVISIYIFVIDILYNNTNAVLQLQKRVFPSITELNEDEYFKSNGDYIALGISTNVDELLNNILRGNREKNAIYNIDLLHHSMITDTHGPYISFEVDLIYDGISQFYINEKIKDDIFRNNNISLTEDQKFKLENIIGFTGYLRSYPLPFKDGERVKLQTPQMSSPIYGNISSDHDSFDHWYYYITHHTLHDIDISYSRINMTSIYHSYDWIESASNEIPD